VRKWGDRRGENAGENSNNFFPVVRILGQKLLHHYRGFKRNACAKLKIAQKFRRKAKLERNELGGLSSYGRTILKWILKK
jgi:hypothetical protein